MQTCNHEVAKALTAIYYCNQEVAHERHARSHREEDPAQGVPERGLECDQRREAFGTGSEWRSTARSLRARRCVESWCPPRSTRTSPRQQSEFEGFPFEITIERIEPERLFSFRWHPFAIERDVDYSAEPTTSIVFELEEVAEGIMLTVTESGFDCIPLARRAKAVRRERRRAGAWWSS